MIFRNGFIFSRGEFLRTDISVEHGQFTDIGMNLSGSGRDLGGDYIIPGYFDIHTHGCMGRDFTTASVEDILKMRRFYASHGVTSILATIMTAPSQRLIDAAGRIAKAARINMPDGAKIRGINLEGPFFGHKKNGAHDPQWLTGPDEDLVRIIDRACGGKLRIVSVDPSLEGAQKFIKNLSSEYVVSIGHSDCGYQTASMAVENGADHITHLFNAMNPVSAREPGIFGTAADSDPDHPVYAELICDLIHVCPAMLRAAFSTFPKQSVIISDSISPTGCPDGDYISGGLEVTLKDNRATLEDGTIAGSVCTVADGVKNLHSLGFTAAEAVSAATINPALSVHSRDTGDIRSGGCADFLIADRQLNVKTVFVGGKEIPNCD